jgi:DNA-binding CsgD family transcriptional regulator
VLDHLAQGRESYRRREWRDAYRVLSLADEAAPLDADDLDRLATAAYLIGRDLEFQRHVDRLHHLAVSAGDRRRAARSAFWLALTFLLRGEAAQANAWVARGQRLLQGLDCVERGYLLLPVCEQLMRSGKLDEAYAMAGDAADLGNRGREPDLVAAARHGQGRARIEQGDVAAGLGLLDEAMLAVVAGELSPIMTGLMYCSVIDACRRVYATSRAREWTLAFSRFCERQPEMLAFTGTCLVHRAEVLLFQGAWPDSMAEVDRACARSRRVGREPPGAALYQQGEIHRLRGEHARAEEAYRAASGLGHEPQPGLALLRLAQGRTDAACASLRRVLGGVSERPERARFLPACIEILLRAGAIDEARRACVELHEIAEAFDADVLRAIAAQHEGAIALAASDPQAALAPLGRASAMWRHLAAPYEAACTRVLTAQACRALGDEDASALELAAARAAFEQLGARLDVARLEAFAPRRSPQPPHLLTPRERHVLRLIAAGHTNKAIAAQLGLSERTIDRHVSNILNKLNVPSRAAATAYGYDHKLL